MTGIFGVLPPERGRGWLGHRLRSAFWRFPPARQRGGHMKHNVPQTQPQTRRRPPHTTYKCSHQVSFYFHIMAPSHETMYTQLLESFTACWNTRCGFFFWFTGIQDFYIQYKAIEGFSWSFRPLVALWSWFSMCGSTFCLSRVCVWHDTQSCHWCHTIPQINRWW